MEKKFTMIIDNILVGRKKIEWIANNVKTSQHAELRLLQKDKSKRTIKQRILESPLAWKTRDNCVAVATDLFHYFIINPTRVDKDNNNYPLLVTIIDLTAQGITVVDKFMLDYKAFNTTNNTGIYQTQNLSNKLNLKYKRG